MTIITSTPYFKADRGHAVKFLELLQNTDPQLQTTWRQLMHVLRPPIDAPRLFDVLRGANLSIKAFGSTLVSPNKTFIHHAEQIQRLAEIADMHNHQLDVNSELEKPLLRRMLRYPGWALCMTLANLPECQEQLIATGVKIALSLITGKSFPHGYANDLRRTLIAQEILSSANLQQSNKSKEPNYLKHFEKAKRNAIQLFESIPIDSSPQPTFETSVINFFNRNQTYAHPTHRRGVLDHRCQSKQQLIQSASSLRKGAEQGDDTALLAILAFCSGLSLELTFRMPLINHAPDNWVFAIDVEKGLIKTNLKPLFPGSATPPSIHAANHRPANRIVVKPLLMRKVNQSSGKTSM
jgi:hypothetical protein